MSLDTRGRMARPFVQSIAFLLAMACGSATSPTESSTAGHPTGTQTQSVSGFTGRPFGIRVSSKGDVYVTQQDANSVAGFPLTAPTSLLPAIPVGLDPGEVVFNRAGTTAYVSAYNGGAVHVIDVASRNQTATIAVSTNAYRLALSSDESRLFVTSVNGFLFAVPTRGTGLSMGKMLGGALQGLALAGSGRSLFVSSADGGVWRVDPASLTILGSVRISSRLQEIVLSPDETELYVASEDGWLFVLDADTFVEKQRISFPALRPFGMAMTPDGVQLYVTSPATGEVAILERATRATVRILSVAGTPRRVAFGADGGTAVVANENNSVMLIR